MKRRLMALVALAATVTAPVVTAAVARDNFLMRNGHDLAALCGAGPSDPYFERALAFCHG